jgi:hypothetical protein
MTKPAPHEVLVEHMSSPARWDGDPVECACGKVFSNPYTWAAHALGRVGLDADPLAPEAVNPFE